MIEVNELSVGYGDKKVVADICSKFENRKLYAIVGVNGCGKSTFIKSVGGIIPLISGKVKIDGELLENLSLRQRALRSAYLPQTRELPDMTVSELVLHGRYAHLRYPRVYSENDKKEAFIAMERLKISDLASLPLSELSGGMRQKAYLAMALAQNSNNILLDEPTSHLDLSFGFELMKTLKELTANGKCIIAVLHDIPLAMRFADEICVIDGGKMITCAPPEDIFLSGIIDSVFNVKLARQKLESGFTYYIC